MERKTGTISIGIRCPIIRENDNLSDIVVNSVLDACKSIGFSIEDRDIISVTESVVARAQGNYASVDDIATDIKNKFPQGHIGIVFPILSRNRFAICLKGIAKGAEKITLLLSYPADEVGNQLLSYDQLDEEGINPCSDVLSLKQYRQLFGINPHPFTGVDYVAYYQDIIESVGTQAEIIFANNPLAILNYTRDILVCDIHSRFRTRRLLKENGAETIYGLDDILTVSIKGSGHNSNYGLLGSNKATEDTVKLFPDDCEDLILDIQKRILEKTGKHVEVMVYGDGAFKDPKGKIWELADPVVSPAFTEGLKGSLNEIKLKYLADNDYKNLSGQRLKEAVSQAIREKENSLSAEAASFGTTPRQLTDLIGSLCDLTSGSGDKGTPVVLVKNYFDDYSKQ
ncbi:MAG TPA: coenzyme F420-0:L-glutamate ligase [Erysipelotrichaceae bacterium]|jgi:F420-0:gamma-glutamyl ligase|nr:coenzyme F420-0:L-glutamate ligase [Erysipelotrichaceae bacterium]HQB31863.1 coenzyme F420-0:L-glutamate ligase [Erysipelotrichaceae bacterium]